MAAAKNVDWILVEEEYCAGTMSLRQIAKRHGIDEKLIRRRALKEGWVKDLSAKIRQQTHAKIAARDGVRDEDVRKTVRKDKEIVENASNLGVEIQLAQRKDIVRARAIVQSLFEELSQLNDSIDELEGALPGEDSKTKAQIRNAISLSSRAKVANDLTKSLSSLVPLEREAFGLDDKKEDDGSTVKFVFSAPPPVNTQDWLKIHAPKNPEPDPTGTDGE